MQFNSFYLVRIEKAHASEDIESQKQKRKMRSSVTLKMAFPRVSGIDQKMWLLQICTHANTNKLTKKEINFFYQNF